MNDKKKWFKVCVFAIRRVFQYSFITFWCYYVCITIYNSTLINIYQGLFPDGVSSSQKLPADFFRTLPTTLSVVIPILVVGYLLFCIIEYVLKNDLLKSMINILAIGIVAICIKIPEYIIIGFYPGNEGLLKQVMNYMLIAIAIILMIRYLKNKRKTV